MQRRRPRVVQQAARSDVALDIHRKGEAGAITVILQWRQTGRRSSAGFRCCTFFDLLLFYLTLMREVYINQFRVGRKYTIVASYLKEALGVDDFCASPDHL